jgi:tRNA threonylcarbamoyladenosine modification (KEOPS) complex  Pcc1 subunit
MSINTSVHHVKSITLSAIAEVNEKGAKYRNLVLETEEGMFRLTVFADDVTKLRVHLEETL